MKIKILSVVFSLFVFFAAFFNYWNNTPWNRDWNLWNLEKHVNTKNTMCNTILHAQTHCAHHVFPYNASLVLSTQICIFQQKVKIVKNRQFVLIRHNDQVMKNKTRCKNMHNVCTWNLNLYFIDKPLYEF